MILAVDVYERLEKACEDLAGMGSGAKNVPGEEGNSRALVDFLRGNRLPTTGATGRLSAEEIDRQVLEERGYSMG